MAHVIAVAGKGGVGKDYFMRDADSVSLRTGQRTDPCSGCRCKLQPE